MANSFQILMPGSDALSLHGECDTPSGSGFNFMKIYKNKTLKDLRGEIWMDIPNYVGEYMVSSYGRIKGLQRCIIGYRGAKLFLKDRILSQGINGTGYCVLRRTFIFNGKQTNLVHRIVASAFLQNISNLPEVNHLSGDKTDNRVSNLEWCTRSQNLKHAADVLFVNTGINHFRSKFTKKDVIDIFYSEGTEREIAARYNVSHSVVGFIKRKQSYKKILNGLC